MKERSLFANSAWGMIAQAVRGIAGLVFVPLVIAKIGIPGYGIFSLLMLLSFYQGLLQQVDLGYVGYLVNWAARDVNANTRTALIQRIKGLVTGLFLINIFLGLICWVFSAQVCQLFKVPEADTAEFLLGLLLIFAANFFSMIAAVAGSIWVAKHRNALFKRLELWNYLVYILVSLGLLQIQPSVRSLALGFLISQMLFGLILLWRTKSYFSILVRPGKVSSELFKADWPEWKPFLSLRLNGMAQRQSDMTLLSILLGPSYLAVYDISMKIPSLIKSFMGRISEALVPFASRRRNPEDMPFIRELTERLITLEMGFGIFFCIICYFFGEDLVQLWLGAEQRGLGVTLFYGSLLNVVLPPASVLMVVLMGQAKRNTQLTWWPTWISIFNIVATIPVTYYFSVQGTILLTVLQFAMLSVASILWSNKDFQFQWWSGWKVWLKLTVPTLLVSLLGSYWLSPMGDPTRFVLGFVVLQLGLMVILGLLLRREVKTLRALMSKKATSATA